MSVIRSTFGLLPLSLLRRERAMGWLGKRLARRAGVVVLDPASTMAIEPHGDGGTCIIICCA